MKEIRNTMPNPHTIGDSAELAALYSAGAMPPDERVAFEAHLKTGCLACATEVRKYLEVAVDLSALLPEIASTPASRAALFTRLRQQSQAKPSPLEKHLAAARFGAGGELITRRAGEDDWEETAVPGVRIRVLNVDKAKDEFVALVRMEAGASYPSHRHGGAEQCLVLDGELRVGDDTLKKGDYQFSPQGSRHPAQSTDAGCLLFITSSLADQFD